MAYGKLRTTEDWERNKQANLYLFGKESDAGCHFKQWREKYERDLARQEGFLKVNPTNTIRQAEAARLRKLVEEYRELEDRCP